MTESNHVVVHFANGRLLKGATQDFNPNRLSFHLVPADGSPAVEVECSNLKALFFVKDLDGNPARSNGPDGFADSSPDARGKRIAVRFHDGEVLYGYSCTYLPGREGFFVFPADARTNNLRIFVIKASTIEIKVDSEAEALAEKMQKMQVERNRSAPRRLSFHGFRRGAQRSR